ncbi:hypothetical protein F4814DRAFT_434919 [Daldinia grandis]|nr:hypothetical protein F4814DRAFT_434919 [Daldinia grandis]
MGIILEFSVLFNSIFVVFFFILPSSQSLLLPWGLGPTRSIHVKGRLLAPGPRVLVMEPVTSSYLCFDYCITGMCSSIGLLGLFFLEASFPRGRRKKKKKPTTIMYGSLGEQSRPRKYARV